MFRKQRWKFTVSVPPSWKSKPFFLLFLRRYACSVGAIPNMLKTCQNISARQAILCEFRVLVDSAHMVEFHPPPNKAYFAPLVNRYRSLRDGFDGS